MFSKHRHDKQKKNKKINKQTNHPRNLNDNFSSGPFFFTVDKLKVDVYLIGLFWRKKTSEFFLMFLAAVCLHSVIIQTRGWMNLLAIFPCRIYVHKKPWSLSRFRRARLVKSRGTLTAAISSKKLNAIEITLTIRHAPSNQILCDILPSPPSLLSLSLLKHETRGIGNLDRRFGAVSINPSNGSQMDLPPSSSWWKLQDSPRWFNRVCYVEFVDRRDPWPTVDCNLWPSALTWNHSGMAGIFPSLNLGAGTWDARSGTALISNWNCSEMARSSVALPQFDTVCCHGTRIETVTAQIALKLHWNRTGTALEWPSAIILL